MKTTFLDSDAFDDPNLEKAVSGKGTFLFAIPATASLPQGIQQKISAITGGTDMPAGTGPSYDAIKIIAAAIAKAGTNPDQLAAAIRATQYDGVSGQIAFDQNGDLTTVAYTVEQIENGKGVVVPQ